MRLPARFGSVIVCLGMLWVQPVSGADPLHVRVDRLVDRIASQPPGRLSPQVDDATFLRRAWLDLAGIIPPVDNVRQFLADQDGSKRTKLVDRLLAQPEYAWHMSRVFDIWLDQRMREREDDVIKAAAWRTYLRTSFSENKSWSQLVSEMLGADGTDAASRPALRFYFSRKGDMGQLVSDVSSVLLGRNLRCAQCHDHPVVDTYRQADFFGLAAFFDRTSRAEVDGKPVLVESVLGKTTFTSTLTSVSGTSLPRVFDGPELVEPDAIKALQARLRQARSRAKLAGDAVRSARMALAEAKKAPPGDAKTAEAAQVAVTVAEAEQKKVERKLVAAEAALFIIPPSKNVRPIPVFSRRANMAPMVMNHPAFRRNIANRLWALVMGRGLVMPLDLEHAGNPASHPKLMALLADEVAAQDYDIKSIIRELMLTRLYARSTRTEGGRAESALARLATARVKPLSPEQLAWSWLRASGRLDSEIAAVVKRSDPKEFEVIETREGQLRLLEERVGEDVKAVVSRFVTSIPGETSRSDSVPEQALFLLHAKTVRNWLKPTPGNLIDSLVKLDKPEEIADHLFVRVLSRKPTDSDVSLVREVLAEAGDDRSAALSDLAWALMSSSEFRFNH